MTQNQPYHQFKTSIANKLIQAGIFDADWFASQESRLNMLWLNNETPEGAYDVIGAIAEAKFSGASFSYPTIASLAAVGCEF